MQGRQLAELKLVQIGSTYIMKMYYWKKLQLNITPLQIHSKKYQSISSQRLTLRILKRRFHFLVWLEFQELLNFVMYDTFN